MRAIVFYNDIIAGELIKDQNGYLFKYEQHYLEDPDLPSISLSLPKREPVFSSEVLFPFFFGLLAEGEEKFMQCRSLKIDENDHFTRLIKTANENTIGAVTVRGEENE